MQNKRIGILEIILSLIALTIAALIFLKAIIDIDTNYDVGWYHLPFAARIWRIVPAESFVAGAKVEDRYDGFPLLAHFFQGLLWKITGRIQATPQLQPLVFILYCVVGIRLVWLYLKYTAIGKRRLWLTISLTAIAFGSGEAGRQSYEKSTLY
jgi:FtsH-binding integral membrane protein